MDPSLALRHPHIPDSCLPEALYTAHPYRGDKQKSFHKFPECPHEKPLPQGTLSSSQEPICEALYYLL